MMTRTTALGALIALAATTLGVAQSTPPSNSTMTPSNSSTSHTPSGNMNNDSSNATAPSNTGDKVGQDPKMKACMTSEKAKNTGLSDNEMKQKCMMQIASHQGQSK
jgi:hypothetical protein